MLMKMVALIILGLASIPAALAVSNSITQEYGDFLNDVKLNEKNNVFTITGMGQTVNLKPCIIYDGVYQEIKNVPEITAISYKENTQSSYKFGTNITASTTAQSHIDELCWDINYISTHGQGLHYEEDNVTIRFGNESSSGAIEVSFQDLVDQGFKVNVTDGRVHIMNPKGNDLNLDPRVRFSTNDIQSYSGSALNNHTFVLAYFDDTNDDISYILYDTNGTTLKSETDISTTGSGSLKYTVNTASFNSTTAVVTYMESSNCFNFSIISFDGISLSQNIECAIPVDILNARGVSDVSAYNSTTFVVVWENDSNGPYYLKTRSFDLNGNLIGPGETGIQGYNAGAQAIDGRVTAVNDTVYIILHDGEDGVLMIRTFSIGGTNMRATAAGSHANYDFYFDIDSLNSTYYEILVFNDTSNATRLAVYDIFNNKKNQNYVFMNQTANYAGSGIYGPHLVSINNTNFAVGCNAGGTATAAVYGVINNTDIYGIAHSQPQPIINKGRSRTVASGGVSLVSTEQAVNIGFCGRDKCIYISSNSTTAAFWEAYFVNETSWDGTCPLGGEAPSPTPIYTNCSTYSGTGDYNPGCNCTINATTSVTISGGNLNLIGSGWFILENGYIENFTKLHIEGNSASDRCRVFQKNGSLIGVM